MKIINTIIQGIVKTGADAGRILNAWSQGFIVTLAEDRAMGATPPPASSDLLLESGSYFLIESGSKLILG